jgi:hypothetical protein
LSPLFRWKNLHFHSSIPKKWTHVDMQWWSKTRSIWRTCVSWVQYSCRSMDSDDPFSWHTVRICCNGEILGVLALCRSCILWIPWSYPFFHLYLFCILHSLFLWSLRFRFRAVDELIRLNCPLHFLYFKLYFQYHFFRYSFK